MLDLLVVPERSIGNEQWEMILGKFTHRLTSDEGSYDSNRRASPHSVPLYSGMTVCQAVQTLKTQNQTIKGVRILYSEQVRYFVARSA